jgi:hypothetical protein
MSDELFIERALLGSVLSGAEIPGDVTAGMFSSGGHRTIFKALQELKPQCSPDIRILVHHLTNTGKLDEAGGPAYIADLTSIVPGPSNVRYYAETLIEDSKKRETEKSIRLAAENIKRKDKDTGEISQGLIQALSENRKPARRKTAWTVAELLAAEFPSIQWIVPNLIAAGLTVLAGQPKMGKSWLALCLSLAVSGGGSVLGRIPVSMADVFYLSLEDTGRRLQNRLKQLQAACLDNLQFYTEWTTGTAGLAVYLREHRNIRMVIIDTWIRFLGPVDINDYGLSTKNAASLKAVADGLNAAILVITHTKKGTSGKSYEGDWIDGVIGSQGLSGAADSTILLRRGRGSKQAELLTTGRDITEQEIILTLDLDCGGWIIEGDKKDIQESELRQSIVDWLKENGPHTPAQITRGTNEENEKEWKPSTIKTTLARMVEAGILQRDNGNYFVTEEPELAIW